MLLNNYWMWKASKCFPTDLSHWLKRSKEIYVTKIFRICFLATLDIFYHTSQKPMLVVQEQMCRGYECLMTIDNVVIIRYFSLDETTIDQATDTHCPQCCAHLRTKPVLISFDVSFCPLILIPYLFECSRIHSIWMGPTEH